MRVFVLGLLAVCVAAGAVRAADFGIINPAYTVLTIKPSATDARITSSDVAHVVIYDRAAGSGHILLFLTGTGGEPPGPLRFLNAAVAHGYRVISLSYPDRPAVAQVCMGDALASDPQCAERFRERRVYGTGAAAPIDDAPQDAIMNRFVKLLQYLVTADPKGVWNQYLNGDTPIWSRVAVSGQSQGGGMAEIHCAARGRRARCRIFGWMGSIESRKDRSLVLHQERYTAGPLVRHLQRGRAGCERAFKNLRRARYSHSSYLCFKLTRAFWKASAR